jgi:hypothetical protein
MLMISGLSANPHDAAVDKCVGSMWTNWSAASANSNPQMVEHLMEHRSKIDYDWLALNKDDRAFAHLLQSGKPINWKFVSRNSGKLATEYALSHDKHLDVRSAWANTNDLMVKYLIECAHPHDVGYVLENNNDLIADVVIGYVEYGLTDDGWYDLSCNSNKKVEPYILSHKYEASARLCVNRNTNILDMALSKHLTDEYELSTNPSIFVEDPGWEQFLMDANTFFLDLATLGQE